YQGFIEQQRHAPSIREELAASHLRVANILYQIGAKLEALAAMKKAHKIQEKLVRDHPTDPEYRQGLFAIEHSLGCLRDGSPFLLLAQPPVQKELNLSRDQVRQIALLMERRRAASRDLRGMSPDGWRRQFKELADQEKALIGGLRPEQARRLQQIAWQQAGAGAFDDPKVGKALQLTAGQKAQIRALLKGFWIGDGGRRDGRVLPEAWKKAKDSGNSTLEQILNVLTAEQKEKWAGMTGAPFKGPLRYGNPHGYEFWPSRNPKKH